MAHYTNVTQSDIESFLFPQGFRKLELPGTGELVYGRRIDQGGLALTLRVYTGISQGGNSRGVGEDAMRCVIFWRKPDGNVKMIGGSKRVHRVEGWRKNLQNRLNRWQDLLGPSCPQCHSPMVERTSKNNGKFYGCSEYPACKSTKPISYRPSAAECRAEAEIQYLEQCQE